MRSRVTQVVSPYDSQDRSFGEDGTHHASAEAVTRSWSPCRGCGAAFSCWAVLDRRRPAPPGSSIPVSVLSGDTSPSSHRPGVTRPLLELFSRCWCFARKCSPSLHRGRMARTIADLKVCTTTPRRYIEIEIGLGRRNERVDQPADGQTGRQTRRLDAGGVDDAGVLRIALDHEVRE